MVKIPPIPAEKRAKAQPFINQGYFTEETLQTYWADGYSEGYWEDYWEGYQSSMLKIKKRATEAQFREVTSSAICHMLVHHLTIPEMAEVLHITAEEVEALLPAQGWG